MPEGERSDVRVENDFVSEGRLTKRTEIVRAALRGEISLLDHLMFLRTQFT